MKNHISENDKRNNLKDNLVKLAMLSAFPLLFSAVILPDLAYYALGAVLLCMSVHDIITLQVPDIFLVVFMVCGFPFLCETNTKELITKLSVAVFIIVSGIFINRKKYRLGGADIKIMAILCLITGPMFSIKVFVAANFLLLLPAVIIYVFNIIQKKTRNYCRNAELPFVPFIFLGFITVLFTQ